MFRVGKIMSRAPIMSGMHQFPRAPIMAGVSPRKIMIVPCIVNSVLYDAGSMTPPVRGKSRPPSSGTGTPGLASCQRSIMAMIPPMPSQIRPNQRNCLAMTLWSVEKTCFRRKVVGSGWM